MKNFEVKENILFQPDMCWQADGWCTHRPFTDIALWLNGELMKNASEIGCGRFLYAACPKNEL